MKKRPIAQTGLSVTPLMFGASGLGNMPDTYGYEVDDRGARDTLNAIFDGPVNCIDTSNIYGFGRSEERIGAAIRERGGLPEGFVISTKLDRDVGTGRFDAERVRRSVEESLTRLGLDRVDILHLHDPEHARDLGEITGKGGAIEELLKLKDEGIAGSVGLAMGRLDIQFPLIREFPFECLISHNRFSLLNRAADEMFDYAYKNGIAVLNAAPYAGGVLAKGADAMPRVTYQKVTGDALAPVRKIEVICKRHNVEMGAVALQYSTRDPRITSTIIGVTKPDRVSQTLNWANATLPDALWAEIDRLEASTEDPEANRDYRPE